MAVAAVGLFLLSVLLLVHVSAKGADAGAAGNVSYQARENDAYSVGLQAYIYGMAPVTMEQTEQKMVTTPGMAPAGNESNWLPAPDGNFYLILRMYQPGQAVLNGTYQIPPVQRTGATMDTMDTTDTM